MNAMQLYVTRKGAMYTADCAKCGATIYAHEWATGDHNETRDALEDGTARCPDCGGHADAETFAKAPRPMYAARYSMPGYLDCTDWSYGSNRRELVREVRAMYCGD